ncbi:MAG TPA: AAA family ATPase [Candidatus Elarobacter sp.]|nr:AAA family ATPase [Candidatus Elarobacter sp.]
MNRSGTRSGKHRLIADAETRSFSRARLYARLDDARRSPVTLVIADEGLGKSTLIRDYLALRAEVHIRFTAGPEHAALGELLRGLATAFSTANPAMARSFAPASLQLEQPDGEATALSWVCEHIGGMRATVVLDEMHHVVADARCASFLTSMIDATIPNLHWVVVVRDATTLPVPRWLSSGIADLPIESAELRVQPDEIRAAFAATGIALDPQAAQALYARTDGWALGLSVALATGRLDVPPTRDAVYDGLVDAAFLLLPACDSDRVYEFAAVGRFDDRVAAALECAFGLTDVLRECRLIYACDDAHHAFYEPCRQRIVQRLDGLAPERRGAILDRAAAALERVGRWREALALRMRANDEEQIARALEARGFRALDQGEVSAVTQALAAVSDGVLRHHPIALAMKGILASLDESFDVSEAWFTMAIAAAHDGERREIVIRYGMDLVRRGRHDVVELLEAEAAREETRSSPDVDAALWGLLGTAYVGAHRDDDAREAVRRALIRLPGVQDDDLRARLLHQASYVALHFGDITAAKSLAERALARADETFLYDLAARALSVLFNVAMLHDDDVPAARRALLRLEEAGRKAGSGALRLYAMLNAYAIEADAGDTAALERLDGQLREMQVLLTRPVSEALLPAQALRAAWDGQFSHAYDLLAPGAEKELTDDGRTAYRWAEIAVYAAAAGKHAEARDAIGRCGASLRALDCHKPLAVRTAAYVALAEILLGDDTAALAALTDARAAAASGTGRFAVLVEAVAAFYDCGTGRAAAFLALGDTLDELDGCDLRGVARFIGKLPLSAAAELQASVVS